MIGNFVKNFHFLCYIAASEKNLDYCTEISVLASSHKCYWSPGNVHFYPGGHVRNFYTCLNIFLSKSWSCFVSCKASTHHTVFWFKYPFYLRKGTYSIVTSEKWNWFSRSKNWFTFSQFTKMVENVQFFMMRPLYQKDATSYGNEQLKCNI